jgi:predicted GNAT family N-acyltransferase
MKIWISIPMQLLELYSDNQKLLRVYSVSTASRGAGEIKGSFMTPRGRHLIRAKIGGIAPENAVFVQRRPTDETWTPELAAAYPERDWILTRILWLSGREPGCNRLGQVDTMRRYIYLHGSPETAVMGKPGSIGCIRMRNRDIMELFEFTPVYTEVDIAEFGIREGDWAEMATAASAVREAVFITEQKVPMAMEYDGSDPDSLHVLAQGPDDHPIGTGRLLPDGHIGRMAVLKKWRGHRVGTMLLLHLIEAARQAGLPEIKLNAQCAAEGFYRRFGFNATGTTFMEAGIPHIRMWRSV